ncbi:MAG: ADP-ribose pyrophosphatase YjhB (NUDIX family) [Glaciecola sp.]|jgi:ADP-ribose pyrophosphatase YjhB (NUDIX family)
MRKPTNTTTFKNKDYCTAMTPQSFNIKVYGLLIKDNRVLVSDELAGSSAVTTFPGDELEFGQSIEDCLIRSFEDALDINVKIDRLFYVNDFYQASPVDAREQIVSIYFIIEQLDHKSIHTIKKTFAFPPQIKQCFRWMDIQKIRQMDIASLVDQEVVKMLQQIQKLESA